MKDPPSAWSCIAGGPEKFPAGKAGSGMREGWAHSIRGTPEIARRTGQGSQLWGFTSVITKYPDRKEIRNGSVMMSKGPLVANTYVQGWRKDGPPFSSPLPW